MAHCCKICVLFQKSRCCFVLYQAVLFKKYRNIIYQLDSTMNLFWLRKLFHILQLQRFGAKLKERRVYFRKRSKALSHTMKENLYSELLKTTEVRELLLHIRCICMFDMSIRYTVLFQEAMLLATRLIENRIL